MAQQEKQSEDSVASKALRILAYPVSAALAFWTARVNISDAAHDEMKRFGALKDIKSFFTNPEELEKIREKNPDLADHLEKRNIKINKVLDKQTGGLGHNIQSDAGIKLEDAFLDGLINDDRKKNSGLSKIIRGLRKDETFKKTAERKSMLHLDSLKEEYDIIHRSHMQSAIINGVTIGAVSLGAMLTAANMKILNRKLDKIDDEKNPAPPSL